MNFVPALTFHPDFNLHKQFKTLKFNKSFIIIFYRTKMQRFVILAVFLFSLFNSSLLNAQDYSSEELRKKIEEFYSKKNYDSAIVYSQKAIYKAEKEFGKKHLFYVLSLHTLAYLYETTGNYEKAEPLFTQAMQIYQEEIGENHPKYISLLTDFAFLYEKMDEYEKAEPLYIRAMQIYREKFGENDPKYAVILHNLALLYHHLGDYESAVKFNMKAMLIRKNTLGEKNLDYETSLNNIAVAYYGMERYEAAEPFFKKALIIRKEILGEKHPSYATNLHNLALLYCRMGKYEAAETFFKEALYIRKEVLGGNHLTYTNNLSDLAVIYRKMGRYDSAEALYRKELQIYKDNSKDMGRDYANCLDDIGYLYLCMGKYKSAEKLFKEAISIMKDSLRDNYPDDFVCMLFDLGVSYYKTGRYIKSESLYTQGMEIRKKLYGENHKDYATSLDNLAWINRVTGRYKKSESLHLQTLKIRKEQLGENHKDYATSLNDLAFLYDNMGLYEKAEQFYLQSLEIRKDQLSENHKALITSLNNLSSLYNKMGKYEQAEPLLKQALEIRKERYRESHPDYAESLYNLALLYDNMEQYDKAEALYRQAIEIEKEFFKKNYIFLNDKEKMEFGIKLNYHFELFNSLALKQKESNPGILENQYDNVLFCKDIFLHSSMKRKNTILNSGNEKLIDTYKQWISLKDRLNYYSSLSFNKLDNRGIKLDSLDSLENVANEMEKQLNLLSDDFAKLSDKKIYSWNEVQNALTEKEAAIEIVRFEYFDKKWTDTIYYAALILTGNSSYKSGIKLVLMKNGNDLESSYISQYKSNIEAKQEDVESYYQFWKPIADKLNKLGVKKVYLSPEGVYNQINLSTLYNPESGNYLIDELDINMVGSTKDIIDRKKFKALENTVTLIGNPVLYLDSTQYKQHLASNINTDSMPNIDNPYFTSDQECLFLDSISRTEIFSSPGTRNELETISKIFIGNNWQAAVYKDKKATEGVIQNKNCPRVLHIATQGIFLNNWERKEIYLEIEKEHYVRNPLLNSILLFTGAENTLQSLETYNGYSDDGLLPAYEAMNLSLDNTELVVISACETELDDIKNGEGTYGLQRAFQQAGARTIIMSLWDVDDNTTQQLITKFYEKWLSGKTKRQAFIEAQQELKEKYRHPYYWGAFVMVGE